MNCKTVQNNLSAYLDRELSGAEMLEIRGHLMQCDPCREEVESLRTLKRLLSATSVPEPSADLADRLCASVLAHHKSEAEPPRSYWGSGLRGGVLTFAGVAACSMALTYVLFSRAWAPPAGPEPMSAISNSDQDLAFDVQRDQVYATGLDATSGVPVLLTPQDAGR